MDQDNRPYRQPDIFGINRIVDPIGYILFPLLGLALAFAALEKEAGVVFAHPWDNIGYTAFILGLYLLSLGLVLCLVCLAVLFTIRVLIKISTAAYEIGRFLIEQPILLAKLVATTLTASLHAVRRRLSR